MKDNNQRQDVRWSAVILLGLAVALIGVGFIVSAPLDADARNSIGVGLLTGVIVGGALTAVEYALERRGRIEKGQEAERQRRDLIDYANRLLARLVVRHARELYMSIYRIDEPDRSSDSLPGFRGREDSQLLVRGVQWVADKDETDPDWYKAPRTIESVDVLLLAGSQMAECETIQLHADGLTRLRYLSR